MVATRVSDPDLPVLYSFRRCPYAMRARMALHASGRTCELREIVLRDKAPEFLAASPKGTVPVVVEPDGNTIEESLDVMLWALKANDPELWLQPEMGNLDDMLELIAACDGDFKQQLDAYKYAPRDARPDAVAARQAAVPFLLLLNERLADNAYLFGARATLADNAIFPFVRQFANVDRAWFDGEPWPDLLGWLEGFLGSDRFAVVMTKFDKWQTGQPPVHFG